MSNKKTFIKGLGFCGNEPLGGSHAAAVDVQDGRNIRFRPHGACPRVKREK